MRVYTDAPDAPDGADATARKARLAALWHYGGANLCGLSAANVGKFSGIVKFFA